MSRNYLILLRPLLGGEQPLLLISFWITPNQNKKSIQRWVSPLRLCLFDIEHMITCGTSSNRNYFLPWLILGLVWRDSLCVPREEISPLTDRLGAATWSEVRSTFCPSVCAGWLLRSITCVCAWNSFELRAWALVWLKYFERSNLILVLHYCTYHLVS